MSQLPPQVSSPDARVTKTARTHVSPDAPNFFKLPPILGSLAQFSSGTKPNFWGNSDK